MALLLVPLPARTLELDGRFGRWSVGGFAEGYAVVKTKGSSQRQLPAAIFDLNLDAAPWREIRGVLDAKTTFGGTPENADGVGVINLRDTFQNVSPSIEFEEGYVEVYLPQLDIRLGKQKFSWGRLDAFQPTDILCPRRYNDPFLTEEIDAKIGIPSLRLSYYPTRPSWMSVTLIWVPVPVPFRFPLEDERWFPSSLDPRDIGSLVTGVPDLDLDIDFRTRNASLGRRLANGAVGVKLSGLWSGVDWNFYYYNGQETRPAFDLGTTVASPNAQSALDDGMTPTVADLFPVAVTTTLSPRSRRVWLFGFDLARSFSRFTLRGEAAYSSGRLLPRSIDELLQSIELPLEDVAKDLLQGSVVSIDLGDLFVARDTLAWGAAIEYPIGEWTPILQLNQTHVLDNSLDLLIPNVDTRIVATLRRTFLSTRLTADVTAVQGLERSYTTIITRFTYALSDSLRIRVGYLLIAGSRNSEIGQYKDNDEFFARVRFSY